MTETPKHVVSGVITMQALTLEDGTTLALELAEPQSVYAVVEHVGDEVAVISMHRTEGEAVASIAPQVQQRAAEPEGGSTMSVGYSPVEVTGYQVSDGVGQEVMPCEPCPAYAFQVQRDGKPVITRLYWTEGEAKAAERQATVNLGRLPGVVVYLGGPPTPR